MTNLFRQHIHIYHRIADSPAANPFSMENAASRIAADLQASRFEISFEQAFERLESLPRMFIELDGSFVWSGQQDASRWQIDGMLYDRNGRLQRAELAGQAPRHHWEQLLNIFGQPLDTLTIHCLQQQRFIQPAEFLEREF